MTGPSGEATSPAADELEWWHEAITMALYVGLSLLAVIVALPDTDVDEHAGRTLLLTALALLLAHQVAYRLSARLVHRGLIDAAGQRMLAAQLAGGAAVAVVAAAPVFLLGPDPGVRVTELLLLAFVAGAGFLAARNAGKSLARSIAYVALLVVVVAGVLFLKAAVGH